MAEAFYKIFKTILKMYKWKTLQKTISPGMLFSVFAGNTAFFKRKGHTENKVYLIKW